MEELSPAVSVALSLNNPIYDNPVELTRLKLITEAVTLLSDPPLDHIPNPDNSYSVGNEVNDVIMTEAGVTEGGQQHDIIDTIDTAPKSEDEILPLGADTSLPIAVEIEETEKGEIVSKVISLSGPSVVEKSTVDLLTVSADPREVEKNQTVRGGSKSVFELEWVPLWGSVSICGKRPEMEDAVAVFPRFMKVPIKMFVGDHLINGLSQSLSHITSHFFGVYDGHGGSQVADFCRDRIHFALTEELNDDICNSIDGNIKENQQVEWQKAFTSCFQKVDDEVGGKAKRRFVGECVDTSGISSEPIAPETVGSTAVVALISSSHIIVSNCGDSRAVLYRGKEAMPLSVDHKPNREDEYERIEASGGKVIQWNGHRVFGVLAMSRSIGDRYLKPWIIPEPEVTFIPRTREDECLILASDGLWDVMTNDEVCEIARRRILLWHKKNGDCPLGDRGVGADPAAQAAADYLSIMALQKGSKDNISIIVVDLKAQRKFKTKALS